MTGSDIVGSVAHEIRLLAEHGRTVEQAIAAAGSRAREYFGVHPWRFHLKCEHQRLYPGIKQGQYTLGA